jgi:hypothetical protein
MMNSKTGLAILFFFLFCSPRISAQEPQFSGWLAAFNTFKLNNRFSLHFDGQLRSTDGLEQVGTILLRPGLNFHLNKTFVFSAGHLFNIARRNAGGVSSLLTEHRPWQQALINLKIKKVAMAHRFRFEERFIPRPRLAGENLEADGYDQAFRFRYFIRNLVPLTSASTFTSGPFFALQNELFLNTGDKSAVNGKTFDQNRLYGAFGYRKGNIDYEIGYMNQYTNTRTSFVNNHIVQLAVYTRL